MFIRNGAIMNIDTSQINRSIVLATATLYLLFWSIQSSASNLKLGVFPYFSAAQLVKLHKPLKTAIAKEIKKPLHMVTAPSFKTFKKNTAQGHYDLVVTAPHLGRLAQVQTGYQLLGFTSNTSYAVFAVQNKEANKQLSDFKGKTITLPPKAAIIHHLALAKLKEAGLTPGKDIQIHTTKSHNNAMISVIEEISPIAAFGKPTWAKFRPEGRDSISKISESERIPGFAILAHPRLGEKSIEKIKNTLLNFEKTEAGQMYFNKTGLRGFREASKRDLKQMDFYLKEIEKSKK